MHQGGKVNLTLQSFSTWSACILEDTATPVSLAELFETTIKRSLLVDVAAHQYLRGPSSFP